MADLWTRTLARLLHDLWLDPAAEVVDNRREELRTQIARSAAAMGRAWKLRAESGGYFAVARELEAIVDGAEVELSFQDYFVRLRHDVDVTGVRFDGSLRNAAFVYFSIDWYGWK